MKDDERFRVGDIVSIGGVYADGTFRRNIDPIDPQKPLKRWRVRGIDSGALDLQPLMADGSVDAFNDAGGAFRITR